jgi:hypothetical protein
VSAGRVPERAPKDLLLPMSLHIENKGLDAAEPGVLVACFQEARRFSPGTRARFGRLAARAARDCGDDGPDADRRFDFVITHDRDLVIRAAQPLLDRLLPAT